MEPPFRPYRSQLTRASRGKNQILRNNAEGSLTRAPGGTKHQLSIRPRNLSCSCGTPSKMGSTRLPARAPPEAGRSPAGLRRRLESMRQLPSFLPTFSASVLLITRDGLPLLVLSFSALSLSLSLSLALYASILLTSPFCFLSHFGHSGSSGGNVCTHLPHMAMATPILCSCFGLFTVLTCFLRLLLDRICCLLLRNSQLVSWSWV